jgi:hypothetical protein
MPKTKIILILLASLIALLLVTGAQAEAPELEPLPPYVGIIKNNSNYDISVPSENSLATLIVPAQGWIEFVVWDPKFDLVPYLDGKPFKCQKVLVRPDAFPYMCKNYDFLVEINLPTPTPTKKWYYKKYKKRYRKPRTG